MALKTKAFGALLYVFETPLQRLVGILHYRNQGDFL
jgi:hypothetical protein